MPIDKQMLAEYRMVGQVDPPTDLDLHCPLTDVLALNLTLGETEEELL